MFQVYLDNNLIPESDYSPLEDSEFTLSRSDNTTGATVVGFSNSITFYNAAGAYIRSILVNSPAARQNQIIIEIRQDPTCCEYLFFKGIITANQIEWCDIVDGSERCNTVDCQAIEDTPYTCLESVLVDANFNGFQNKTHPFVTHCVELRPNFLAILVYYFAIILYFIFIFLTPTIFVISTVISVLNAVLVVLGLPTIDFSEEPGTQSFLTLWQTLRDDLVGAMIGCGNGQFAPYVKDYLSNLCDQCDLQLQSTIFAPDNIYTNTMYYVGAVSKIKKFNNATERAARQAQYFNDNSPNDTGTDFLNELRLAFNAGWEIIGNKLVFERKDYFFIGNNLTILPENIIKLCFKYLDKPEPQFAQLSFQPDGLETVGNEALRRNYYRTEDYDPLNLNLNLAGRVKYAIPFAPSRYRNDGIDTDILQFFVNLLSGLPLIGDFFQTKYSNALLMPNNIAPVPKLLIHKTDTGLDNAGVLYDSIGNGNHDYNKDFWLMGSDNYYNRFFAIDNPMTTGRLGREFEMEINYDCEFLKQISLDKTVQIDVGGGQIKTGKISQITISKNTLILRGEL